MIITNYRGRKNKERNDDYEQVSHLVSYKLIRKTQFIQEYEVFYKNMGFYLEVLFVIVII